MNSISILRCLGLLSLIIFNACGSSDGMYTVQVDTGLQYLSPPKNLMKTFALALTPGTDACLQPDLFAGFKPVGTPDGDNLSIITRPLKMVTSWNSVPNPISGSWLVNNASFPPIEFRVPAGVNGFGLIGSLIVPNSSNGVDGAGNCAKVNASQSPAPTYSASGSADFEINSNTTVQLKVWMLPVNTAPSPNPGDCYTAGDDHHLSQTCPAKNFFGLLCLDFGQNYCASHVRLDYLFSNITPGHAIQYVDMMGATTAASIPDINPIKISTLINGVKNTEGPVITEAGMDNKGQFSGTFPEGSIAVFKGDLGAVLTQATPATTPVPDFIVRWNAVSGVANYKIEASPGLLSRYDAGSYTTCQAAATGTTYSSTGGCSGIITRGSDFTLKITANGTTLPSAIVHYRPLDTFTVASDPAVAGSDVTFTAAYPSGATHFMLFMQGAPGTYRSRFLAPSDGTLAGGNYSFTLTGIPSGSYSTVKLYALNPFNGWSSVATASPVNVP